VDADHEIAPTWISTAVEVLKEEEVGAAGALCMPPPDGTWVQRMYGALRGKTEGRSDVSWLGAGNLAVRRQAFESVSGFDASLESCEDVDLCHRLRAAGWRVIGDAGLGNVHLGDPATLAGLFRAERWRGRDNLRVTFRGPLTPRDLPSVVVPVVDACAVVLAGTGILMWPFFGARALALTASGGALVVAASALRTLRMAISGRFHHPIAFAQAMAVAMTYDLARSAALVTRAAHHRAVAGTR
jgi:glycosyl transferase family 2